MKIVKAYLIIEEISDEIKITRKKIKNKNEDTELYAVNYED